MAITSMHVLPQDRALLSSRAKRGDLWDCRATAWLAMTEGLRSHYEMHSLPQDRALIQGGLTVQAPDSMRT